VQVTDFSVTEEAFDASLNRIRTKVSMGMHYPREQATAAYSEERIQDSLAKNVDVNPIDADAFQVTRNSKSQPSQ